MLFQDIIHLRVFKTRRAWRSFQTQRIHLPEPEDLPPEPFRWSESELVASAVIASNSALGGSNGTRVVVPTTLGGPVLGGKEWTVFGDDSDDFMSD